MAENMRKWGQVKETAKRPGWTYWGLEAEGIPLDETMPSKNGCPELPFVRDPTDEEEAGLNAGTRPDLAEKIRAYKKIVRCILDAYALEDAIKFGKKCASFRSKGRPVYCLKRLLKNPKKLWW